MTTFLSVLGCLLLALGGWQIYEAATMIVTVEEGGQLIANLQAMQIQIMALLLGCSLIGAGSVFLTGACIIHRISPPDAPA